MIRKPCATPGCHTLTTTGTRHCPQHQATEAARRNHNNHTQGRNTQHWRTLSTTARTIHPYCACGCGTTTDLTVHLKPDAPCYPHHQHASLADVEVLARSCHGTRDAPRATHKRLINA